METKPTYSHTPISIGEVDRKVLRYLNSNQKTRFNVKAFSREFNINRSTIYDILNRLRNNGLVERDIGNNKITQKGIILIESQENDSVGSSRKECRTSTKNLSTHYHKFSLIIKDKKDFSIKRIENIQPISYKENKLHNLHQIFVKFEDANLIINPKRVIVNLFDVLTEDVDESDFKCLSRLIDYVKLIDKLGIVTEGVILERGHWARIESLLSDFIYEKVDSRYFLNLGENRMFWIDHSKGREDETNDKQFREKVDRFFLDLDKSNYSFSDVDKLVVISKNITEANIGYKPMFEEMNQNILKFAQAMAFYGEHFKSHAGLIKEGTQMFKKMNKKMEQKKLGDWL